MTVDKKIIETNSEQETISFAKAFSLELKRGDVVLLYGDLGMGKTVFSRALVRALCGDENIEVPSPTFTLVQIYNSDVGEIFHFDLYRIADPSEIYEIGWEDALSDGGVAIVEWPERLGYLEPESAIKVMFSYDKAHSEKRRIEIIKP